MMNKNQAKSSQNSHTPKRDLKQEKKKIPKAQKEKEKNVKANFSSVKKTSEDEKHRSGSLSRSNPIKTHDSPRKAQSVDRNLTTRFNAREANDKRDSQRNSRIMRDIGGGKKLTGGSLSTSIKHESRKDKLGSISRAATVKKKSSDNPLKTGGPKTNAQIAKSFVQNSQPKLRKQTKSSGAHKSPLKKQEVASPIHKTENDSNFDRPRTSTIRKGPLNADIPNDITIEGSELSENVWHTSGSKTSLNGPSDDDKASYEEDFEEYDSDFEESDSASVTETDYSEEDDIDPPSDAEEIVLAPQNSLMTSDVTNLPHSSKSQAMPSKTPNEKTFLKMSDRSSLFPEKNHIDAEKKPIKLSRSFINFDSAIKADEKSNEPSQELEAGLSDMDAQNLDVTLDIPPQNYNLIRKSTMKQVFIQTESNDDEEIQTDYIEMANKWTQNPTNGTLGFGGDKSSNVENKTDAWKSLFNVHSTKLSLFLQQSSNIILTLLDEEFTSFHKDCIRKKRPNFFYSDGYAVISPLAFLSGIPVVNVQCSSDASPHIITIHGSMAHLPTSNDIIDEKGVICVWNILDTKRPEYILTSNSQPTCGTFCPGGSDIVIGGMVDGAVMLWDLTELNSSSLCMEKDGLLSFRSPTYNTALILGPESHHSSIVGIQSVYNSSKSEWSTSGPEATGSSKNFHVLTLEDMGVINVWVVVEVLNPDVSGLETDLGLAPGGKFRLVKSSCLPLYNLTTIQLEQKSSIRTFDFRLIPFDSSRILVTTDAGIVLHISRHSGTIEPRFFSCESDFISEVRCIDCSPHNVDLFLVGCSDGSVRLYNVKLVLPLMEFLHAAKGEPVDLLQWSVIHPSIFCVLGSSSHILLWNLIEDSVQPIYNYHFQDCKVTWFVFKKVETTSSHKTSDKMANFIIATESGEVEVHTFNQKITELEYRKQLEYMNNL